MDRDTSVLIERLAALEVAAAAWQPADLADRLGATGDEGRGCSQGRG